MPNDLNVERLTHAIALSGMSARVFAVGLLGVDERTVRRWIAGEREIPGPVVVIAEFIRRHPNLIPDFAEIAMDLRDEQYEREAREYLAMKRAKKKKS